MELSNYLENQERFIEDTRRKDTDEKILIQINESKKDSKFLDQTLELPEKSTKLSIIDFYEGKGPLVLSGESLEAISEEREFNLHSYPMVVLDSHMLNYLDEFVEGNSEFFSNNKELKGAIRKFLLKATREQWDMNFIFALYEGYVRSKENDNLMKFKQKMKHKLEKILLIHVMDEQLFINTGGEQIEIDQETFDFYREKFDINSLGELSEYHLENLESSIGYKDFEIKSELIYMCLLKAYLIDQQFNALDKKISKWKKFFDKKLRINLTLEKSVGISYFLGDFDGLINTQPNMNFECAKSDLLSSAGDIYLLRIPTFISIYSHLGSEYKEPDKTQKDHSLKRTFIDLEKQGELNKYKELVIPYVCTAESSLHELGEKLKLNKLIHNLDSNDIVSDFKFDWEEFLDGYEELSIEDTKIPLEIQPKYFGDPEKRLPSRSDIKDLKIELESQLKTHLN